MLSYLLVCLLASACLTCICLIVIHGLQWRKFLVDIEGWVAICEDFSKSVVNSATFVHDHDDIKRKMSSFETKLF